MPFCSQKLIKETLESGGEIGEKFWKEMHRCYFPEIKSYVLKNSGSKDDAEDVFQQVLIRLCILIRKSKQEIRNLRSFIWEVARRIWINMQQKRNRRMEILKEYWEEKKRRNREQNNDFFRQIFYSSLSRLDDRCRDLLLLKYMEGISAQGIMEQMEYSSESAVSRAAKNCLAKLRNLCRNLGKRGEMGEEE